MAANGISVCDDKKKIRKMSCLSYLKNNFQKKSSTNNLISVNETVSNEIDDDLINGENFKIKTNLCNDKVTTEYSANNFNNIDNKLSFNRDIEYNDIVNTKSNGFFRSIKKRLNIRDLKLCKSKQKIKAVEPASPSYGMTGVTEVASNQLPIIFFNEKKQCDSNDISRESTNGENDYDLNEAKNNSPNSSIDGENEPREEPEYVSSNIPNSAEPQASSSRETGESSPDAFSIKKFNLTEELLKLSKYGWYWGPISRDEADTKLANEPDGAFLVRDSSADKYLLTLSFKSSGKLLHTRVEHSGGLFSLYYHPECERFSSVVALINHSMSFSQSAVYCYSRPRYPGHPAFPVRLTKPVSRFTQVRSLQYLCRFVIRQNTRVDNIDKLPLPGTIREYIEEAHY